MGARRDKPDGDHEGDDEAMGRAGSAPRIAERGRIHDRVAARLFGPSGGAESEMPAWGEQTDVADDGPHGGTDEAIDQIIGRFRVLEPLGRGGMGVVYSAYDPELDRKVAIKLLRADIHAGLSAKDAQARLLREAQAMARLNHPNVIVVHEVGTVRDRVFVAMEFVDGGTLREFMQTRPPWRDVLDVFMKAGAGLAAAHAAGLVHRDFKPDNVLLGRDLRVRVVDFGLARSVLDPHRDPTADQVNAQRPEVDSLHTPLTRTGAVMGTPAYMSPEQHLGHAADARSDQFSFCVALYEGLFGARPFAGQDLITLSTNVVRGQITAPPADVRVPGWIGAALRRGLSPDPKARFPSMQALLDELARDPRRKWRWIGLAAAVAGVASVATYATLGGDALAAACRGYAERMDAVWSDDARQRVRDALVASGEPYGARVAQTTIELIDGHAARWIATAEEVCVTSRMAGDEARDHAQRQRCLDERLAEVEQLVEALAGGAPGMTQQAVPAAADLSDLAACTDERRLAAWEAPEDPATASRVAQARSELARAKANGAIGAYGEAIAIASTVIEGAADLPPAVQASALLVRGQYRERAGEVEAAEADLRSAVERAEAAGDFGTKAQALTRLVFVISREGGRYGEAMELGAEARGVLDTLDAVPFLHAELDGAIGAAARHARDYEVALEHHQRALETRERLLGETHPDTASSLANIGSTLSSWGKVEEAEPYLRRSLATLEAVLGEEHPWVGTALGNLANCLGRQKRPDEALPFQTRSLAILERTHGPDHPSVLSATFNLGKLYGVMGRHADAERLLEDGLRRKIAQKGERDGSLGDWYVTLGENAEASGDMAKARTYHQRDLDWRQRTGLATYRLARSQFAIARTLLVDDRAAAKTMLENARASAVMWAETVDDPQRDKAAELVQEIDAWRIANLK